MENFSSFICYDTFYMYMYTKKWEKLRNDIKYTITYCCLMREKLWTFQRLVNVELQQVPVNKKEKRNTKSKRKQKSHIIWNSFSLVRFHFLSTSSSSMLFSSSTVEAIFYRREILYEYDGYDFHKSDIKKGEIPSNIVLLNLPWIFD